jgi:hypothetical protein
MSTIKKITTIALLLVLFASFLGCDSLLSSSNVETPAPTPYLEVKVSISINQRETFGSSVMTALFGNQSMPEMGIIVDGGKVANFYWSESNDIQLWLRYGKHTLKLDQTDTILFGKSASATFEVDERELASGLGYEFDLKYSELNNTFELTDSTNYEEKQWVFDLNESQNDSDLSLYAQIMAQTDIAFSNERFRLINPALQPEAIQSKDEYPPDFVPGKYEFAEMTISDAYGYATFTKMLSGVRFYTNSDGGIEPTIVDYSEAALYELYTKAEQEDDGLMWQVYKSSITFADDGTYTIIWGDTTETHSYTQDGNRITNADGTSNLEYSSGNLQYIESDGVGAVTTIRYVLVADYSVNVSVTPRTSENTNSPTLQSPSPAAANAQYQAPDTATVQTDTVEPIAQSPAEPTEQAMSVPTETVLFDAYGTAVIVGDEVIVRYYDNNIWAIGTVTSILSDTSVDIALERIFVEIDGYRSFWITTTATEELNLSDLSDYSITHSSNETMLSIPSGMQVTEGEFTQILTISKDSEGDWNFTDSDGIYWSFYVNDEYISVRRNYEAFVSEHPWYIYYPTTGEYAAYSMSLGESPTPLGNDYSFGPKDGWLKYVISWDLW